MSPTYQTKAPLSIIVADGAEAHRCVMVDALSRMGHAVLGVDSVESLFKALDAATVHLLILDISLPGEGGLGIARRMRMDQPALGIILLTGQSRSDDKVACYASGADLYLTKPVSLQELGAAIDSIGRRLVPDKNTSPAVTVYTHRLQISGPLGSADISRRECALLLGFAGAPEQLLDTAEFQRLGDPATEALSKSALEVQIVRLRKKLESAGAAAPTIKAIRGMGYQLCVPLHIQRAALVAPI
jgi:DNA-binding response OmpR family regulator